LIYPFHMIYSHLSLPFQCSNLLAFHQNKLFLYLFLPVWLRHMWSVFILNPSIGWNWAVGRLSPPDKRPYYSLSWRMHGRHSRSGRFGWLKLFYLVGNQTTSSRFAIPGYIRSTTWII
jgi:hypothetical protein